MDMNAAFLSPRLRAAVSGAAEVCMPLQVAGDLVGVVDRLRAQDEPVDAEPGVALRKTRVERLERHRGDLERAQPRRPVHLTGGAAQPVEVPGDLLRGPV